MAGAYLATGYRMMFKFQTTSNQIYKFSFVSIYGLGIKNLHLKFGTVLEWIWEVYARPKLLPLFQDLNDQKTISTAGVDLSLNTINYLGTIEPWHSVTFLFYKTHFIIQDKENQNRFLKLEYVNDWDAIILYAVIQSIGDYHRASENNQEQ